MDIKRRQAAEAASLSRTGTAILRSTRMLRVKWLEDNRALGFTGGSPFVVNVAWDHDLFNGLSDEEKAVMRMGIFAHELLHQCLTNFDYTNEVCEKMSQAEASVFMNFANTLEDPAIEYFAHNVFGGNLLDALHFQIRHLYMVAPGLGKEKYAFQQLINALIQFGDMGIIKGKFTFPEAEEYFRKVAPLYNEGIECPDSKRRIDIAKECMQICRPLWEQMVKDREEMEKLIEELLKSLQQKGAPKMDTSKMKGAPDSVHEKRSSMVVVIKKDEEQKKETKEEPGSGTPAKSDDSEKPKENSEEKGGSSGSSGQEENDKENNSETEDGSSAGIDSDSDDTEDVSKSGSNSGDADDSDTSDSDEDGEGNSNPDSGNSDSNGENNEENTDLDGNDNSKSESSSSKNDSETSTGGEISRIDSSLDNLCTSEETANEQVREEYEINEDVIEKIQKELESEILKSANAEKTESASVSIPDFNITSNIFKSAKCLNREVNATGITKEKLSGLYNQMVNMYNWDIKCLTKSLEKIFESEQSENYRATSGSYNIKRGSIGTTARIFDKRREKGNLKDAAVVLCIDQSGSMGGVNIEAAKKAAIVFAEALTKLKIPYYIMGFTADRAEYDALHNHFVTWENKPSQRTTLATLSAGGNNFDGYSIRYAAELLKARSETNKIMFVISDGQPACCKYSGGNAGIIDTTNAIKDSRKFGTVFGIALGYYCGPELLQGMYGKDFIHCPDTNLLTQTLCKQLERVFKNKKA